MGTTKDTGHARRGGAAGQAWRRLLFLLIGGLVAIPYALIITWAVELVVNPRTADEATALAGRLSVLVVLVVLAIPAFLPITRTLERTAANQLLDLRVPEPTRRASVSDLLRSAVFFAGHLISGALAVFALVFVIPLALTLVVDAVGGDDSAGRIASGVLPGTDIGTAIGVLVVIAVVAAASTVAAAILLPWYARTLLGPSALEQAEILVAEADRQARRNELARELHDSIGHALTVTSIQATAARRMLDTDLAAARVALGEIERVGRTAVAELDYALGLLRAGEVASRGPERTIADLDILIEDARNTGLEVTTTTSGDVEALPRSMGRELYRIAQEALTNVLRHGSGGRAEVMVAAGRDTVSLFVTNPASPASKGSPGWEVAGGPEGGRGTRGIRERVLLLGGSLSVGPDEAGWRLAVLVPRSGVRR
jgi:signal transduction histidine kinase